MNVLGIDYANRTAFSHTDGYRDFMDLPRAADKHPGERLIRLEHWLTDTLNKHKTELIAAEDASFGSNNQDVAAKHNELRGIIHLVAAEFGLPVKFFVPTTIKLFAAGNGHASKQRMIRAAKIHFGIELTSDDIADAFWVMHLAQRPDCWPEKKVHRPRPVKTRPPEKRFRFGR